MSDIKELIDKIKQFNHEREWAVFHHPKEIAISVVLEASELLEHFQWKDRDEADAYIKGHRDELGDEMADVFIYLLQISDRLDIDLIEAARKKIEKNGKKYPVEKSRGNSKKYTEL